MLRSFLLFLLTLPIGAATFYGPSAVGGAAGTSCATAAAIGSGFTGTAGTTYTLCNGPIKVTFTVNGSGTSTNPITIAFDCATNGQIAMPAIPATGVLTITGSFVTIDGKGCGFMDGANASSGLKFNQIESTNNGTASAGYGNSVGSQAIILTSGNDGVSVQNLTCGPLYNHVPPEATSFGAPYPACIAVTGANLTVQNNIMHDCAWCVYGEATATTLFHNNTCYNFDHCLGMGNTANGVITGPVYFYNNNMYNATTWDTGSAGQYHHDGIHLWAYTGGGTFTSSTYWNGVYIYNNYFHGNWGPTNTTADIFLEVNVHNVWIFNNLLDCSLSLCSAVISAQSSTNGGVINNTILGNNSLQIASSLLTAGPNTVVQNNVNSTSNTYLIDIPAANIGGASTTISALSNNVYMAGSSSPWVWHSSFLSSRSSWNAASGETNDVYSATSTLNSDLSLQSGSPAIGAGANLYSTCNGGPNPGLGALCRDAKGIPRPTTGVWDAGALSYSTGTVQEQSPTNLTAVVN